MSTAVPRERLWTALVEVVRRETAGGEPFTRLLATDPATGTAEFSGAPGDAIPGFRVVEAEPGRRMTLRGRHRFSDYQLTFLLDDDRLRAQTHAAFPGLGGRIYRALVIGSGGHRIITRRIVRRVVRRAAAAPA